MAPQIIYLILFLLGLLYAAFQHGKGIGNFWSTLIAGLIQFGLLIWGGFFNIFFN